MTPHHRVTSAERIPEPGSEDLSPRPREHNRALQWAQLILTTAGITAALTIWTMDGPPLIAAAVATAAAGSAGWQITVNVRR
ncbi:hypothetical protein [Streptomyces rubrogriseus]|uniref:hypothetical protein n=1 Tax=Streptomyces rubrogriseus TaxID=194673 RepID=UPI00131F4250|nr:hypothetical protein [Streptomyces rubrogriseus]